MIYLFMYGWMNVVTVCIAAFCCILQAGTEKANRNIAKVPLSTFFPGIDEDCI